MGGASGVSFEEIRPKNYCGNLDRDFGYKEIVKIVPPGNSIGIFNIYGINPLVEKIKTSIMANGMTFLETKLNEDSFEVINGFFDK